MSIYLETPRIQLRQLTQNDAQQLFELDSDPAVMQYLTGGVPHAMSFIVEKSLPHYLSFYERFEAFGFWAAIERSSNAFMGWFHFKPYCEALDEIELGYRLKRVFWGRGYATEGSLALVDKGFGELGVKRIVATTMSVNRRSRRVMEKAGLRFEREFVYPSDPFPGWRAEDCLEVKYGLTREQWLSNRT